MGEEACKWGQVTTPTPLIDMELMFGRSSSPPAASRGASRGARHSGRSKMRPACDVHVTLCKMEKAVLIMFGHVF